MPKIRCNKCHLTWDYYFDSCKQRVCDNKLCPNSRRARNDQMRKVSGQQVWHVVFQDTPKPGRDEGNVYILKPEYSSNEYIIERIGYRDDGVLILSVELIVDKNTGETIQTWMYVKPRVYTEEGEQTATGVSPKPEQYTPCED